MSVTTQHNLELMEPESREAKGNVFYLYYRGNHYNKTLLQLMKLAEAVGEVMETGSRPEEPINPACGVCPPWPFPHDNTDLVKRKLAV